MPPLSGGVFVYGYILQCLYSSMKAAAPDSSSRVDLIQCSASEW